MADASTELTPGRFYNLTSPVTMAAGHQLTIPATTTVMCRAGSAAAGWYGIALSDRCGIHGSGVIRSDSTDRTSVYGLLYGDNADDVTISAGIRLQHSPSAGVWVMGGSGLTVDGVSVRETGADGIHISRGASDFAVTDSTFDDVADDAIGVVSYLSTGATNHDPCTTGTITGNTIRNVTVGRGIAIVGGHDVLVDDNSIDGTDQAGIIVSKDPDTHRAADVQVSNNTVNDTGRDMPIGGTDAGIYVSNTDVASVTGNAISNTVGDGIELVASSSTSLSQSGNTFANIGGVNVGTY